MMVALAPLRDGAAVAPRRASVAPAAVPEGVLRKKRRPRDVVLGDGFSPAREGGGTVEVAMVEEAKRWRRWRPGGLDGGGDK